MKIRDSGMPDQASWETFFDPPAVLAAFGFPALPDESALDLGCGYGTFALTAAALTRGTVHALDLEPEMIATTRRRATQRKLTNLRAVQRDFLAEGSGLPDESVGFVMLFNVLHTSEPVELLREARRVLAPGGRVGIIHWRPEPDTPRGPPLAIRPRPEQCGAWARQAGLLVPEGPVTLPPYHFGLIAQKP